MIIADIEAYCLDSAIIEAKKRYYNGTLDNMFAIKMEIDSERNRNRQWPRPMEWHGIALL